MDPNSSVQTGEARSRGIEVDLAGEITPAWSLIAAYAYTDARITQDNSGREGFRVEAVPEHSSSVWTRYRFLRRPLQGLSVGAGVFAAGKCTGFENDFTVPGYARVDALAAIPGSSGRPGSRRSSTSRISSIRNISQPYSVGRK